MKRAVLSAILLLLLLCTAAFSLDVNKQELESVANQKIQFLNYEGPPSKIETKEQIRGIGRYLGQGIGNQYSTRDYFGRYRVIHAVDPTTTGKLDADIVILEKDAVVDHIDNVRLILQGYLQSAYGYNDADSTLLAYFVTIYNAVYRGNMVFFNDRYKPVVTKNVTAANVGIATSYRDWPGKTRMIIPLGVVAGKGELGALSPTELVGPKVIDELRTRQDMGIEQRKAMVNLMERTIQQKEEQLQKPAQQAPAQGQTQQPTQTTQPQTTQTQQPAPSAQQPQQSAQTTPSQAQAAQTQQTQKQIQQLQQAVREQRDQISRDQKLLLDEAPAQPKVSAAAENLLPVTFLAVEKIGGDSGVVSSQGVTIPYGRVVKINPLTFAPVQVSSVKAVLGRHLVTVGQEQRPVVVAVKSALPESATSASGTSSSDPLLSSPDMGLLVRLDPQTLDPDIVGTDTVFPGSILEQKDGSLYAVIRDAGQWHLGRFDANLKLIERSAVAVNPYTTITFRGDRVWVQTADDRVIPLLIQDLRVAR